MTAEVRSRIQQHKPALLAVLEREQQEFSVLAARIRDMAERWHYTDEDLAWALDDGKRNPAMWLDCCAQDEAYADRLRRAGMRFLP